MDLHELSIDLFSGLNKANESGQTSIGLLLFFLAFLGAMVNLPSFLLLKADSIYQRIIWRYLGLALFISPKFIYDLLVNITSFWGIFVSNIFPIFFLSLLNTAYVYMMYFAVQRTYVAHTLLLCSIGPTFSAVWKIIKREPYTTIEYIGIGVNVFGAYLCCCDQAAHLDRILVSRLTVSLGKGILIGDFMAILSSAVYAIYACLSKPIAVTSNCPISVYLMLMAGYVVGISFVLSIFFNERIDIFSTDEVFGLFAFITDTRSIVFGLGGLGFMAGFVYHFFTLQAQEYLGGMFINVCYNFTPFLSQVTAYLLSAQADFPGTFTAFGGAILFIGCTLLAMSYQDQQDMSHVPVVGKLEGAAAPEENLPEMIKPPIEPEYAQPSEP